MLGICTLLFAFNLNTYDVSKLFVVAKAFIGKSKDKPLLVATPYAATENDKKTLNKSELSDKGNSFTMETHFKSNHDMPPLPLKRQRVINFDDDVELIGSILVYVKKFVAPFMWMSSGEKIDHVILSKN